GPARGNSPRGLSAAVDTENQNPLPGPAQTCCLKVVLGGKGSTLSKARKPTAPGNFHGISCHILLVPVSQRMTAPSLWAVASVPPSGANTTKLISPCLGKVASAC